MRYSQEDGVNSSLSRLTVPTYYFYVSVSCLVYGDLPRHGRVLTGTIIIKMNVCTRTIPAGAKCPPPSKTTSPITWFEA